MTEGPAPVLGARGFLVAALVGSATLAPALQASAHDLWILPGSYVLSPSEPTRAFINSGDVFPESLSLLAAHRVAELVVRGPGWPDGRTTVTELRVDGTSLTFELAPPAPGLHVVGLETRPRRVRLKPEDFADYLVEEGLDEALALWEASAASEAPAVERYAKWAKTMVEVVPEEGPRSGEPNGAPWAEPLGHRIEIVPLGHPNRGAPGEPLRFRVLFEGEPLPGARVVGGRAGGPARALEAVTDASGEASVEPSSEGRWYLRTIHMIPLEDDPEVRWESFWCTLSFEVSGAREAHR